MGLAGSKATVPWQARGCGLNTLRTGDIRLIYLSAGLNRPHEIPRLLRVFCYSVDGSNSRVCWDWSVLGDRSAGCRLQKRFNFADFPLWFLGKSDGLVAILV